MACTLRMWVSANPRCSFQGQVTSDAQGGERGSQRSIGAAQGCAAAVVVLPISCSPRNDGYGAHSGPSRGDPLGALTAHLRRSLLARRWPALDPERPFEVSPMNRRYAAECGRRRNGEIAPGATVPEPKLRTSRFDPNRSLHPATPYRRPTSSGPMRAIWPPRDV
jgi:hypothetical protein